MYSVCGSRLAVSMRGKNCQCGEFLFRLCGIMLYNFLLSGGIPYVGADLAGAVSMQGLSVWSQGLSGTSACRAVSVGGKNCQYGNSCPTCVKLCYI